MLLVSNLPIATDTLSTNTEDVQLQTSHAESRPVRKRLYEMFSLFQITKRNPLQSVIILSSVFHRQPTFKNNIKQLKESS